MFLLAASLRAPLCPPSCYIESCELGPSPLPCPPPQGSSTFNCLVLALGDL